MTTNEHDESEYLKFIDSILKKYSIESPKEKFNDSQWKSVVNAELSNEQRVKFHKQLVKHNLFSLEKNSKEPINLAGGTAIKVKDWAEKIISITGYNPKIEFDQNKPSGHMKRILDSKKSKSELGFQPNTNLDEGLLHTIEWYKKQEKT